jgi:endonuclease-8
MEGPSLVILKEETQIFKGREVLEVNGYAVLDQERLLHNKVLDIKTWGKHFLLCFKGFTLRIHFMLFGSYRINDAREGRNASISLHFSTGTFNGYICKLKILEGDLNQFYDWSLDMLSPEWDPVKVKKTLLSYPPDTLIGDVLLDAKLFSGVGNIIRNEVLYRVRLHPDCQLQAIPPRKLTAMIKQTKVYSYDFLEWKKKNELAKHWEVYTKTNCPLGHPITKTYTGKTKRRSFICEQCMVKY